VHRQRPAVLLHAQVGPCGAHALQAAAAGSGGGRLALRGGQSGRQARQ
jgi:hypothetical protein